MNPLGKLFFSLFFCALACIVVTHVPASADPAPATVSCGTVDLSSTSSADASKSFDCFTAAFQRCNPASLAATGRESDVKVSWSFLTVSGAQGCAIWETVNRSYGSSTTTDAFVCTSLSNEKDGLHFNQCGPKGAPARPEDQFSSVLQPLAQQPNQAKT